MTPPLRGCVVWINGPPGIGKLTVASELSDLLGPDVCPPPVPYNRDGEVAHRPDEPPAARRARVLDRVLWARDRDAAAADPNSHRSWCPRCRGDRDGGGESESPPPANTAVEDVIIFTDWQRLDTASGRAAAAEFRSAAQRSGRRFLAVHMTCARTEHVRRATASPGRLEAAARWERHVAAARAAGVQPSGRHHRGPLVVDAGELERLLDGLEGGNDNTASNSNGLLLLLPGCAAMDLDGTATEPREAAWLLLQRVRWEAALGADRLSPPSPWRRLLFPARPSRTSPSPPPQRLLPAQQQQQGQEGASSSAASVFSSAAGTSRPVSANSLVRLPSPSRMGSRESLWVRSRRRWRGAVPTGASLSRA